MDSEYPMPVKSQPQPALTQQTSNEKTSCDLAPGARERTTDGLFVRTAVSTYRTFLRQVKRFFPECLSDPEPRRALLETLFARFLLSESRRDSPEGRNAPSEAKALRASLTDFWPFPEIVPAFAHEEKTFDVFSSWHDKFSRLLDAYAFCSDERTTTDKQASNACLSELTPDKTKRPSNVNSPEPDTLTPEIFAVLLENLSPDRKRHGVYYTPRPIVEFLCREAIYPNDSNEACYLDPACGAGSLLVGLLWAWDAHVNLVNETPEERTARRLTFVQTSLFGIDTDPLAILATRFRLYLAIIADSNYRHGFAVADLPIVPPNSFNLRVGDALLMPDDGKRFDAIVMNPPYRFASRVNGVEQATFAAYRQALTERYGDGNSATQAIPYGIRRAKPCLDLYMAFLRYGLRRRTPDGTLCAITPDTYLTQQSKAALRDELIAGGLQKVICLGKGVFPASVYPAIAIVSGSEPAPEIAVTDLSAGKTDKSASQVDGLFHARQVNLSESFALAQNRRVKVMPIYQSADLSDSPIESLRVVALGEIAPARDAGIHSGNIRHKLFFRDRPDEPDVYPLIQGTQVVPYGVWWDRPQARYRYVHIGYQADSTVRGIGRGGHPSAHGEYWHRSRARSHDGSDSETLFRCERLLMRQTADCPIVGYLPATAFPIYTDNTVLTLILTEAGRSLGFTYPILLALLNSAPLRDIYQAMTAQQGRVLPQVKTYNINRLPVPVLPPDKLAELHQKIVLPSFDKQASNARVPDHMPLDEMTLQTKRPSVVRSLAPGARSHEVFLSDGILSGTTSVAVSLETQTEIDSLIRRFLDLERERET